MWSFFLNYRGNRWKNKYSIPKLSRFTKKLDRTRQYGYQACFLMCPPTGYPFMRRQAVKKGKEGSNTGGKKKKKAILWGQRENFGRLRPILRGRLLTIRKVFFIIKLSIKWFCFANSRKADGLYGCGEGRLPIGTDRWK